MHDGCDESQPVLNAYAVSQYEKVLVPRFRPVEHTEVPSDQDPVWSLLTTVDHECCRQD